MKKNFNILFAVTALLLALGGCGTKPTAPAHTNPADPESPDYQSPGVVMTGGPAEGSTVTVNDVTFTWSGTGSAALYSYSLDNPFDWSGWSADSSKSYSNLSEGLHTFRVKAADAGGYQGDTVIAARSFTVNEVSNTVLMYPATQTIAVGETAEVWWEMEDMATPVAGIRLLIYRTNTWAADTISASADTGYYWRSRGGTPVGPFFSNYGSNYLDVSLGVAGGSPAGVTGTGRIFKIKSEGLAEGSMYMYIDAITARDTLNNPIATTNLYQAAYIYVTAKKEGGK